MSKTFIQAELSPELVSLARSFVSQSGQTDFNGLLEEALQEFFKHHTTEVPDGKAQVNRQQVFQALASQAETCEKPGWDGYDAEPVTLDAYRCAYRLVEQLPAGIPMPSVGAEPDGHLTLEWYQSPSRVLSVSVGPSGELNYAALLGETSRRTGSEIFQSRVPGDLLQLIHQVFAS
jgi:hypothetical protein